MSFSPVELKKDFPIFRDSNLIYLDNAATTQKPDCVIDSVSSLYREANANVHRAIYSLGSEATSRFENSRKIIGDFINSSSEKEIIFTGGTTESINLLSRSLDKILNDGDEILISQMEHHSNIVPWQLTAQRTGAVINYLPLDSRGELDLTDPEKYFNKKTKIVSITHMSNVLGTINPINHIANLAHSVEAVFIVD